MLFRSSSLREFIRSESNSTRELIRNQHEEFMLSQERRDEEMREFNREILLRNEKVYKAVIVEMEAGRREMEEGRKQIRANTEAVLSMLDRFNGKD